MVDFIATRPKPPGRRPTALVMRDISPEEARKPVDWSAWYLTDEEDMGESCEQGDIIRVALSSLNTLAQERGFGPHYFGADAFFAWVDGEPLVRVSPDLYLIFDPPAPPLPKSWQTWLPGHKPPRWAAEIVSEDWKKDYEEAPLKYAQLRANELLIFDPEMVPRAPEARGKRVPFQMYRRSDDGAFVLAYSGDGPVWSEELSVFFFARVEGGAVRLRLSRDQEGKRVVLTAEERVRELEAELAKLRGA